MVISQWDTDKYPVHTYNIPVYVEMPTDVIVLSSHLSSFIHSAAWYFVIYELRHALQSVAMLWWIHWPRVIKTDDIYILIKYLYEHKRDLQKQRWAHGIDTW